MTEPHTPEPYVERVGFTPMLAFSTVVFLAIGALYVWMATDPQITSTPEGWVFVLVTIVFFGGMALSLLIGALRRGVALRVDQHGVTLGRPLGLITHHGLWWRTPPVTVSWNDIDAVVLFSLATPRTGALSFIGLRLHAGTALPPGEPARLGIWRRVSMCLGQEPPPKDIAVYRRILGWRIDRKRLRSSVKAHARGVEIMDGG